MNISKLICMLIALLAINGFITVGLVAQEEGKQSEGKEKVEYEVEEQREPESKEAEEEKEIRYRGFRNYPSMHSPEPDPGEDPDDPALGSTEDTNNDE